MSNNKNHLLQSSRCSSRKYLDVFSMVITRRWQDWRHFKGCLIHISGDWCWLLPMTLAVDDLLSCMPIPSLDFLAMWMLGSKVSGLRNSNESCASFSSLTLKITIFILPSDSLCWKQPMKGSSYSRGEELDTITW